MGLVAHSNGRSCSVASNVLDVAFAVRYEYKDLRGVDPTLPELAKVVIDDESAEGEADLSQGRVQAQRRSQFYPALVRFQEVCVGARTSNVISTRVAAGILQDLVCGKHFTLANGARTMADLAPWKLLRCKSFTLKTAPQINVSNIVRVVTSQGAVSDSFKVWQTLNHAVFGNLKAIDGIAFQDSYANNLHRLQNTACSCNVEEYRKQEKKILQKALEWGQYWEIERLRTSRPVDLL